MNGHTVAFVVITGLFAFAVAAFLFGDFFYCLAFLATIAAVFYIIEPDHK
jgi:hypothetical protein